MAEQKENLPPILGLTDNTGNKKYDLLTEDELRKLKESECEILIHMDESTSMIKLGKTNNLDHEEQRKLIAEALRKDEEKKRKEKQKPVEEKVDSIPLPKKKDCLKRRFDRVQREKNKVNSMLGKYNFAIVDDGEGDGNFSDDESKLTSLLTGVRTDCSYIDPVESLPTFLRRCKKRPKKQAVFQKPAFSDSLKIFSKKSRVFERNFSQLFMKF